MGRERWGEGWGGVVGCGLAVAYVGHHTQFSVALLRCVSRVVSLCGVVCRQGLSVVSDTCSFSLLLLSTLGPSVLSVAEADSH